MDFANGLYKHIQLLFALSLHIIEYLFAGFLAFIQLPLQSSQYTEQNIAIVLGAALAPVLAFTGAFAFVFLN